MKGAAFHLLYLFAVAIKTYPVHYYLSHYLKTIICIKTHESVNSACEVLGNTLERLGIHCQVVDESSDKLPDNMPSSVVFLAEDADSWSRFSNKLEAGEYNNINMRVL